MGTSCSRLSGNEHIITVAHKCASVHALRERLGVQRAEGRISAGRGHYSFVFFSFAFALFGKMLLNGFCG